ncbi:hypothetical protein N7467_011610 [Penicillium canescens]|nr:hypothetical protein N7467_011610 [Penicillium canescens]
METPNSAIFPKPYAQDDKGLGNEAMSLLLDGRDLYLEKEYFFSNYLDSKTAAAILISANEKRLS